MIRSLIAMLGIAFLVGDLRAQEEPRDEAPDQNVTSSPEEAAAAALDDGAAAAPQEAPGGESPEAAAASAEPTFSLIEGSRVTIEKKCPPQRYVGTPVKFEITIVNESDAPARDVVVFDNVCEHAQFISASDEGKFQDGQIVWQVGELGPRQSKTLVARVKGNEIKDLECPARVEWRAMAAVGDKCRVAIVGIPAILLECIDLNDPVEVGEEVTYEISVTNQGSLEGSNIVVVATLPEQLNYISADGPTKPNAEGQVVTFDALPGLAPKDKAVWTLKAKAVGTGDIRFKLDLTSQQSPEKIFETESTNLYE